jgi:hypothetical protein
MTCDDLVPTLDGFIGACIGLNPSYCSRNAYVTFDGFDSLYVRLGTRYVERCTIERVLDIARVEATVPGHGAFGDLIRHLESSWVLGGIYVECVQNKRFGDHLLRNGWRSLGRPYGGSPSYFRGPQVH